MAAFGQMTSIQKFRPFIQISPAVFELNRADRQTDDIVSPV